MATATALKLDLDEVRGMFVEMGVKPAATWPAQRVREKIAALGNLKDEDIETKAEEMDEHGELLIGVVEAVREHGEDLVVEFEGEESAEADDGDAPETKPSKAKAAKPSKPKAGKAKPAVETNEDGDELVPVTKPKAGKAKKGAKPTKPAKGVGVPEAKPSKAKAAKAAKPKAGKAKAAKPKARAENSNKMSMLEAAIVVLSKSKQPMRCPEIVEAMAAKGLWSSADGKTPNASMASRFLTEMLKGSKSRIKRVDRGLFTVSAKAAK